jgi:formylglycine-generating enzyme required for sulfatase activity
LAWLFFFFFFFFLFQPEGIDMTHVFLSYSRKDISFVNQLAADLKNAGIDVWYDVSGIAGGTRWRSEIENALRNCQAVIVVLSPDSIISEWVEREFLFSSNLKRKIIPLMYRACELPLNYVDLNYIDAQGENYRQNFNELLKALNAGLTTATRPASNAGKPSFKWKTQSFALLGGGAIIMAVLLGSLLMKGPFAPAPTLTSLPASAPPERNLTPAASFTPLPPEMTDAQGIKMLLVPAGKFILGSENGNVNERPVQDVQLDAFYMDIYEVTNSAYKACVDAGQCTAPALNTLGGFITNYYDDAQYGNYPVVYVTWFQARSYCTWRGSQLPTEAQWEKAARGTDGPPYPWGQYINCDRANYENCARNSTSPVGSLPEGKSPYGLYDLSGNVWEWVADWYSDTYYQTSPFPSNPTGPQAGLFRVLRGGSFVDNENSQRSALRNRELPENFNWNIGFRCARDVTS